MSAIGTPTRIGPSLGSPEVIIRPLSAWMIVSMALPPAAAFSAPKPDSEQNTMRGLTSRAYA